MKQLDIESLILSKYPGFPGRFLLPFKSFFFFLTGKILKVKEINAFLTHAKGKTGIDFIDEIFEHLDFSYVLSAKDRDKIRSEGRVVIISNHPLGGLDGLALVKLISEIRPDVKIVVNDFLLNIEELKQFFLPYDLTTPKAQSRNVRAIIDYLNHDHAVIIFPAGVVSRFGLKGIRDGKWNKGFLFFAKATNSPILPLYIEGRNTVLFYLVGLFSSLLSMLMLPRELFKKKRSSIKITIGNSIPPASFLNSIKDDKTTLKLLRKHLIRVAKNKPGIFKTEKNIIHPVGKKELKKQILQ
ncbi:MAG: lysophospholipid acyltransferase family protein [Ignavibacteriaceae bacterium]|nr:lysophospholipid acyltransferase family protein [Ignavibacteriaceae bacterium]